ncbi:Translin [Amniculicola lignicola CBS 123094]|uniref:Translin n=1 Tax=Amniculicola lignicola CBS 123094 TaxID=1392246 RepID=A0A6A5X341_9PLEO|nr:Translin [Amniculicola lignicola CBS 123094]
MADPKAEQVSLSPFMAMFEDFRSNLDEHHDRRERVIKSSRDITASSKKIIFTLQRVRVLGCPVPQFAVKSNAQYWETIGKHIKGLGADLHGVNAYRYERQVTGGLQEFIEALSFQHYLETQTLITYEEATARILKMGELSAPIHLSPQDYVLGIFDMIGELMRFSITSMATNGKIPTGKAKPRKPKEDITEEQPEDRMDIDNEVSLSSESQKPRNVLDDLRELRLALEMFNTQGDPKFGSDVEKKMGVMRECVDKVEKALYSLVVRGKERPKGWMPEVQAERRAEVSY